MTTPLQALLRIEPVPPCFFRLTLLTSWVRVTRMTSQRLGHLIFARTSRTFANQYDHEHDHHYDHDHDYTTTTLLSSFTFRMCPTRLRARLQLRPTARLEVYCPRANCISYLFRLIDPNHIIIITECNSPDLLFCKVCHFWWLIALRGYFHSFRGSSSLLQ